MRSIGLAAWALLLAVPVQAQPIRVVVALPECSHPGWSDAELLGSLGVELRSDGVSESSRDAGSPGAVGWLAVEDACDPTQPSVTLSARTASGARTIRAMNLADVPPELRARAIALALAELLRGSWYAPATARASAPLRVGANAEVLSPTAARPEHDTGRAQPPAAEDAAEANAGGQLRAAAEADAAAEAGAGATHDAGESPPPTAARPLPAEPESPLKPARTSPAVSLGPALRLFAQRTTLLYGARASFRGFDCELGSAVSLANRRDPLGTLHFGVAQVFAAYDVVRIHAGDYGFIASPRLAIGFSWGTAQATVTSDAASAIDLVWDVAAQLLLSRALDERWTLALVIASGYARGPRYDAEREQVSLAGLFADAALSVLWQFGD